MKQKPKAQFCLNLQEGHPPAWLPSPTLRSSGLCRGSSPTPCPPAPSLCLFKPLSASPCHKHIGISTFGQEALVQHNIATCAILFHVWLQLAEAGGSARAWRTEGITRIRTRVWSLTPCGKCLRLPRTVFSCSKTQDPTAGIHHNSASAGSRILPLQTWDFWAATIRKRSGRQKN